MKHMQAVLYLIRGALVVLMAWCCENKACSSVLDFLYRFNNRVRGAREKRIATV